MAVAPTLRAPLLTFFVVTLGITWTCFIAAAPLEPGPLRIVILYVGIFTPALVAIALTAASDGAAGVGSLLRPLFQWRVSVRWYIFALTYMAVVKLSAALLQRTTTGAWPRFGDTPLLLMLAGTVFSTVIGGQAGEEIGWRGFALPRLAARIGFGSAGIVLGAFWALWHLPLFFAAGADTEGQSFILYSVQLVALSVAMAWLYIKTNGSLLLMMLMHAAINHFKAIVPSGVHGAANVFGLTASTQSWLTAAVLWVFAICFLIDMRRTAVARLSVSGATA